MVPCSTCGQINTTHTLRGLFLLASGRAFLESWYPCTARAHCLRLFWHVERDAASRTFCTAGTSNPIKMATMAMTTSSSISVKAARRIGMTHLGEDDACNY